MKRCATCHVVKALEDFAPNRSRKDGRRSYCKPCFTCMQKKKQCQTREIKRSAMRRGCVDCGEKRQPCLDFDHIDPARKSFCLSTAGTRSVRSIMAEIAKCEIRCANCHRIRTAEQQGWTV